MTKLGFLINLELCSDHRNCMVACKREKGTAPGVRYMETYTSMDQSFPNNTTYFLPLMCQHCEHPSCVPACPDGVFAKNPLGPVTVGDTSVCLACDEKPCMDACPYGAIKLDASTGQVGKCDMCIDRVTEGLLPACIPDCNCMAIAFGDMEDEASPYNEVMRMVDAMGLPREVAVHQLKPETGNEPLVSYVLASKPWRDMKDLYSPAWVNEK